MSNTPFPPPGGEMPDGTDSAADALAALSSHEAPAPSGPHTPPVYGAAPAYGAPRSYGAPAAPQGYQRFDVGSPTPAAPRSGKLLAGGIVAVVLSAIIVLIGLLIALLGDVLNDVADDFGNGIVVVGLVVVAFGGFGLASGIGAIMRRGWGKICSIVFGAINGVFGVLGLLSEPDGGVVVYLAMSISIVVLCAMGQATPA